MKVLNGLEEINRSGFDMSDEKEIFNYPVTPWKPTTDIKELKRLGKTLEELGELSAVVARCIIQGAREIDPSSGEMNLDRLRKEIADVYAQLEETALFYAISPFVIEFRKKQKIKYMRIWEDKL